jgi:hypothetical protein
MRSTCGLRGSAQKFDWETGLETSYGLTAIAGHGGTVRGLVRL